jgi:diketogulonate reductase-like aldo/keto reductase
MVTKTLNIHGRQVPRFLYGTAWKEEATQCLTELALQQGFRGIDTANQRRHYHEAAVGQAITNSMKKGLVTRDGLFIQTKFTYRHGQDHRLPYDPAASIPIQVEQSFASSLTHLGIDKVDSYVLHGPSKREGLVTTDWEAWQAMEAIYDSGRTYMLGISNVSLKQLEALCSKVRVVPAFVQNRCFAVDGWDRSIRQFCKTNGIHYQGFSLLTANRDLMTQPEMVRLAKRHKRSISQILFGFALAVGMLPITGTTDLNHMQADLQVFDFELDVEEVATIEILVAR